MSFNPTILWLLAGSILCLIELFVPTAFVLFTMGISALVVGLVSAMATPAFGNAPQFSLQVVLWLLLSVSLVYFSRRLLPTAKASKNLDGKEGRTLTEISAGETGRVLYEGNSWQARCDDDVSAIAPNEKVYIVRRQGTTLFVVPQKIFHD
ncbi:NfeD family protein [Limnofasciculus baicalensis]|uniref:NfeD family protein n=1 Tax=Limnofasciculus baicalensis BBK-W-15 TaxID=2699891 RepID=A0AAE3KS55_9CYAN|nr:NfeD family protein [Limnofasciculus baicalensis]MCP2732328.1 NfeD family protein [Limnofasciculus baicalensis BBK-W-15]